MSDERPEQRPDERPERKIAIVGFTASRTLAPWGDPDWEIWVCNNLPFHCPPLWHRVYDLHDLDTIRSDKAHEGFLRGQPQKAAGGEEIRLGERPVYCFDPQPEWPTARAFPKDEIVAGLGNYFTNSISWMIAHALMEEVTHLSVFGVDMATGTEYAGQRPSCEYLLGIAVGAGVKVYVPPASDLLKATATYGSEGDAALYAKMQERKGELQQRGNALQAQLEQTQLQLATVRGALETTNYIIDVWTNPRTTRRHEEAKAAAEAETNGHVEEPERVVAEAVPA